MGVQSLCILGYNTVSVSPMFWYCYIFYLYIKLMWARFLLHCPTVPYRADMSTPAFPHPVLDRAALSLPQIPSTRWHRWCKCWRRLRTGESQFPRDWSVYRPAPRTLWTARAPVRNLVGHRSGHWQTYWRWAIRKVTCDPLQTGTGDAKVTLKSIDERVMVLADGVKCWRHIKADEGYCVTTIHHC